MGQPKGRRCAGAAAEMWWDCEQSLFLFSTLDRHWQSLEFCDVGDEALGHVVETFDGDASDIDREVCALCAPPRFVPAEA